MNYFVTACRLALVVLLFNAPSLVGFAQGQVRQWSSHETNETVEATFQSYDPNTRQVSLQLPAGDLLVVHLKQLSRADQRFVTKVAKKGPQARQLHSEKTAEIIEPGVGTKGQSNRQKKPATTRTMFGIDWESDIQSASRSASGSETPNDDRPIMWLRVLGDLDGFM